MPSETTSRITNGLRHSRIYSWGSNMDHLEVVVDCASCGQVLCDDFDCADEADFEWHARGDCKFPLDSAPDLCEDGGMEATDLAELVEFLNDADREDEAFERSPEGVEDRHLYEDPPRGWEP